MTEVPQAFDRFEIQRILGKSWMGTVYLARDSRLDRLVSLRVLHIQDLADDDRRARFLEEVRACVEVRHPNVAAIFEAGERDGVPFVVMESCEGETLAQRIRRRPLEAAEFLSISRQIAAGLAAAHGAGVLHGDLRGSNIIIEPSGQVKILDLGLARAIHRQIPISVDSPTGDRLETLDHIAPEQARGEAADARSDLFSLGVLFYQMATGQLPFNAGSSALVLEKIRSAEPEPFVPLDSSFPPAATNMIERLLRKNPAARPGSAAEVVAELEAILPPAPTPSAGSSARSPAHRQPSRRIWPRLIIAAAALAVIVVAIHFARADRTPPPAVPPPPPPIRSIAVIPLTSMTTNARDGFLGIAIAATLVHRLRQIPALQVRPMRSVLDLHIAAIDARTAAEKLRVDGVLEGRYLAAGGVVRISLQLTAVRNGSIVWSDAADRGRQSLQMLIDDLSARTVAELSRRLGVQPVSLGPAPTPAKPKAYEEYLRAIALEASDSPADRRARIAALRRAVALDPGFAAAWARLALEPDADTPDRLESDARQAVRLDPNLARAHLALGQVLARRPDRYRESVHEIAAAVRLNPQDPAAVAALAPPFVSAGDLPRAQCIADRVLRLDPDSELVRTRGDWYIDDLDPEGALQTAGAALASASTEAEGHDIRANAYILLGDLRAASAEADRVDTLAPNSLLARSLKALLAAASGDRTACEAALAAFDADAARNPVGAMRQALCFARMRRRDMAVAWLVRAAELGDHSWYTWTNHPWLQSVRSDPRFQSALNAMKADVDAARDEALSVYPLVCR